MATRPTPRRTPKYRLHKVSGRAIVQIQGRRIYWGKSGSAASHERYRQLVSEFLAAENVPDDLAQRRTAEGYRGPADITVVELAA